MIKKNITFLKLVHISISHFAFISFHLFNVGLAKFTLNLFIKSSIFTNLHQISNVINIHYIY